MLFMMHPILWSRSQYAIDNIATSFDISLQVDGIILCLIFKSLGSYRVIEEESRPKIMMRLSEEE